MIGLLLFGTSGAIVIVLTAIVLHHDRARHRDMHDLLDQRRALTRAFIAAISCFDKAEIRQRLDSVDAEIRALQREGDAHAESR